MKSLKLVKFLLILLLLHGSLMAQIQSRKTIKLIKPYTDISPTGKYLYDSLLYESARNQNNFEFSTFTYNSDGLSVEGYLCQPISATNKNKLPVIIYNRGGTGNYSKLTEEIFPYFYSLAKEGFVVIGSNYRFINEMGKHDELGGVEVNDVVNIYNLAKELPFVDSRNVFMMGLSRGGLMTYSAAQHLNLNAIAVLSGVADSEKQYENRQIFINGWDDLSEDDNYLGLKSVLPDFELNKAAYLLARSPVKWAERINCPVLILHSRQDGFVRVNQAFDMALALQKAQKSYQLKIYDKKSHALPARNFDSLEETISWFKSHMNE